MRIVSCRALRADGGRQADGVWAAAGGGLREKHQTDASRDFICLVCIFDRSNALFSIGCTPISMTWYLTCITEARSKQNGRNTLMRKNPSSQIWNLEIWWRSSKVLSLTMKVFAVKINVSRNYKLFPHETVHVCLKLSLGQIHSSSYQVKLVLSS